MQPVLKPSEHKCKETFRHCSLDRKIESENLDSLLRGRVKGRQGGGREDENDSGWQDKETKMNELWKISRSES